MLNLATTKNYDSLETCRKETTRPSLENVERWNIYSHEWKRSKNGRMEQSKAVEYESRKASSDVLKPRYIYIYIFSSYRAVNTMRLCYTECSTRYQTRHFFNNSINPVWTQMAATSSTCYDVVTFLTQRTYSCSNFVAISSLVLELLKKCRVR
jgi:hypothetical protein